MIIHSVFIWLLDHTNAFEPFIFNFSNSSCCLTHSFLMHWSQRVYLNGKISNSLNVKRGIPQGSILKPHLFCICINGPPNVLNNCSVHMYADDVQLYRSKRMENIINCDLQKVDYRAKANGLYINPSKSKYLLLSRTMRAFVEPNIIIKGNKMDFIESTTSLGIFFNGRLTWSNHINFHVERFTICFETSGL